MKIKMTETVQGSLDGESVQELTKGHKYDTVDSPRGDRLAQYHIAQGVAVAVEADPVAATDAPAPKKAK
ncbi:hypothetical protein [Massilia sp. S19_KUP03_FR1]|uniref:hypothetical protein n=1 Tax=Massilia sp. S19_KUP03_FR1 TaxID=3025503 RepID=UPI002FCD2847